MYRAPARCPACAEELHLTELTCARCRTLIRGQFARSPFDLLTAEEEAFLKVFLRCRGNLREVERMLGYSYPTVRGLLDELLQTLGLAGSEERPAPSSPRQEVLRSLEQGELSVEEALQRLGMAADDATAGSLSSPVEEAPDQRKG